MVSPIPPLPEQLDLTFELSAEVESEEVEPSFNSTFDSRATSKANVKQYFANPDLTLLLQEGHKFLPSENFKQYSLTQSPTHRPQNHSELYSPHFRPIPLPEGKPLTPFSTTPPRPSTSHLPKRALTQTIPEAIDVKNAPTSTQIKGATPKTPLSSPSARSKKKQQEQRTFFSQSHSWVHKDTQSWWKERYHHQREREQGEERKREQGEQQEHERKQEKELLKVQKAGRSKKITSVNEKISIPKKPLLSQPKTGVFALYYILTKIGILSDGTSNFDYKNEITRLDTETTTARKKRLVELKAALEKEQSAKRWGISYKVFSWIASFIGIIGGAAMIATGIGALGGAMLIAGGIINLTSQILEMTGGWHKIAKILPGDDPDKKRAVISWIQTGVAVLCLILSGVGIVFGGFSNFVESTQVVSVFFGSIAMIGQGVTAIGEGITSFMYCNKLSEVKRYDLKLLQLKHRRQDLMEKIEWGVDRLQQLFEDLARALGFHKELFQFDQKANQN